MASHSRPSAPSTSPTSWRCAPAPCQSPVPYNSHVVTTCSTSTSLSLISTSTMEEIMTPSDLQRLDAQLDRLYLSHVKNHYQDLADKAAQRQLAHVEYLAQLIEGEATVRENRAIERRIRKRASPCSRPLKTFTGVGQRRSIDRRFRTCFVWPSSQPTPTSSLLVPSASARRTSRLLSATPPASLATPCSSPPPSTSSTPWPRHNPPAGSSARSAAT